MAEITNQDVMTMVQWMAGYFTNQTQAFDRPREFAQIRLWQRPLPWELFSGYAIYVEQANELAPTEPYRRVVLHYQPQGSTIFVANYLVQDDGYFKGAAQEPERLQALTQAHLAPMTGCGMIFERFDDYFRGVVEPGKLCRFEKRGHQTYLNSISEVRADSFMSLDRGFDLESNEQIWGSFAGPFKFVKVACLAHQVPQLILT